MDKLVLFDVGNTLIKDTKDVSEYVLESIRNIYGTLVDVNLSKYEGLTAQETAEAILKENGMPQDEIEQKLVRYTEDMFYSYYNVAGRDWQVPLDGAREILDELSKKDVLIGAATGEPEKITRFRLEKTDFGKYFKFGAFGNEAKDAEAIIFKAIGRAVKDFNFSGATILVCSTPNFANAAQKVGIKCAAVANAKFSKEELEKSGADVVVRSLKERSKIFSLIEK